MPIPEARQLLEANLRDEEWKSIYYSRDVVGCDLTDAASVLGVEIPTVKKYRRKAYTKLEHIFFPNRYKGPWLD